MRSRKAWQRRIGHLQELAMTQTPRQLDTTETMSERKLPRITHRKWSCNANTA